MELLNDDYYGSGKYSRSIEDLIENGYETDVYRYVREGWEIFKKNAGLFVAYTVVYGLIVALFTEIRWGGLLNALVTPLLAAGWYIAAKRTSHNEELQFANFFDGFKIWQKIIPYYIVAEVFMIIGFILLVIPGIYLAVSYVFILPIILFYKEDLPLMDVLEGSRKVVTKKWWNFFGLMWLLLLVNIAGALCLGVGLLASIPVSTCALYAAYEDVFGVDHTVEPSGPEAEPVSEL